MIIAIDGPAGSGKSTVAKAVAKSLGMHYLDTGAMYRAVAWVSLDRGIDLASEPDVVRVATGIDIEFIHERESALPTMVLANGHDVTNAIRTPRIDDAVSIVARMADVRAALVAKQRAIGEAGDIVVEGRDIGTVVFPTAGVKVYLTASAEERARRRHLELEQRGEVLDETLVHERMAARDSADSSREVSPLSAAPDAHVLDTTGMSIEEVVSEIARMATGAQE